MRGRSDFKEYRELLTTRLSTRDVEAFLKKTAIAYHPIWPFCVDLGGMQ